MSQLPSVWFCPECGHISHSHHVDRPGRCCPDQAPEFVTEETARLAYMGFRALVYRELPAPLKFAAESEGGHAD